MKLKMKHLLFTAAMCAVMLFGTQAHAVFFGWTGDGGDNDFLNGANWIDTIDGVTTGVPQSGDRATVKLPGANVLLNGDAQDVGRLAIEDDAVMTIGPSGSIHSTGFSFLGRDGADNTTGTLNINGGTLTGDSAFIVGRTGGILNMNSGLMDFVGKLHIADKSNDPDVGKFGMVQLDGGMIVAGNLFMGPGDASLDITAGVMKITTTATETPGDIRPFIDAEVLADNITGYGGAGTVMHSFDPSSGTTTIWAVIPEPASIVLLGLAGSLLAIGRRR